MILTAEIYNKLEEKAKEIKVEGLRKTLNMKIGQVDRQGDIYIHRVEDNHPHGDELKTKQLAIGESQGSRHIAGAKFKVYQGTSHPKWVDNKHFLGPCIVLDEGFEMITHPEHANFALSAGTYQITHQMDLRTQTRVRD